jgi:hypothetical protein
MIMSGDKKKLATIIIKRMQNPEEIKKESSSLSSEIMDEKSKSVDIEKDNEIAYESMCSDIMDCIEKKDKKGLKSALKNMITMIMDEESNSEE